MDETARQIGPLVRTLRWTARILGGLMASFCLLFFIGEGLLSGGPVDVTAREAAGLTIFGVMVIALVIGWFWEGVAAAMLLGGYALLHIVQSRAASVTLFLIFPLLGTAYLFCWWRSRGTAPRAPINGRRVARGLAMVVGGLLALAALAGAFLGLTSIPGPKVAAPPAWIGAWQGEFDVVMRWWPAGPQPMTLTIAPDGSVTGTLGQAPLVDGHVQRNNRVLIWLGNAELLVTADLTGWVVESHDIAATAVGIFLRESEDGLTASFQARGKPFGGTEAASITSKRFTLRRVERPSPDAAARASR